MKIAVKNLNRVIALVIAIMVCFSMSAFADVAITDPADHTVGVTENITVTVTGATVGEEVALLIYDTEVSSEKILYVDQTTATDTSVVFTFGIRDGFDKEATYIVKAGSTNSAAAATNSLVFEEIKVNGVKVTSVPTKTVYNNGEAFDSTGLVVKDALNGVAQGDALTDGFLVSEVDTTTAGAKLVVVTKGDYTDTFAIFVQPAAYVAEPVTGISDVETAFELGIGSSTTLVPTVAPAEATNKAIKWVSLDPTVATVSDAGLVEAIDLGKTSIIGVTVDGGFAIVYDVAVRHADIVTNGVIGRIVDGDTGLGIAGAELFIEAYDEDGEIDEEYDGIVTDEDGYFKVEVAEGTSLAYITISAEGYIDREIEEIEFDKDTLLGNDGVLFLYRTLLGDINGDGFFVYADDFGAFKQLQDDEPSLDYSDVE